MKLCCEKLSAVPDLALSEGQWILWLGGALNGSPQAINCCPFCGAHLSWYVPKPETPAAPAIPTDQSEHVGESATITVIEGPDAKP